MRRKVRRSMSAERPRSLKVTEAFKAFVLDQLIELGDIRARSMFGGVGLYYGDVFFGILARDTLFLKVDETNRRDYEDAGMEAFRPYLNRSGTMTYYAVPVGILESPLELAVWARRSVAVAQTAASKK